MTVWFFQLPFHLLRAAFHDAKYRTLMTLFENHRAYHRKVKFMDQYVSPFQYI